MHTIMFDNAVMYCDYTIIRKIYGIICIVTVTRVPSSSLKMASPIKDENNSASLSDNGNSSGSKYVVMVLIWFNIDTSIPREAKYRVGMVAET